MHLEAAVALPFFILFFMLMSWLITLAETEAVLRDAVNETVKTVSAHAYPADLLLNADANHLNRQEVEQLIARYLPLAVKTVLEKDSGVRSLWAVPLLMSFVDLDEEGGTLLKEDHLSVTRAIVPTFMNDDDSYFGLTAEYRVPIPFPFIRKDIVLTATAVERSWVGLK